MKNELQHEKSSFRDRDGYIFYKKEDVFRHINLGYLPVWEQLKVSPFFKELVEQKKVVNYEEVPASSPPPGITIKVEKIPFISYPSEWSFGQLKKAALLTLAIQKKALQHGFSLKDASGYNVQFNGPKAIFIDTLSFEFYREGQPWQAYQQFCRHFLAPLLLAHYYNMPELKALLTTHIDGIPLDLCSKLLPFKSKLNLLAYTHIHLHARFEKKHRVDVDTGKKQLYITKARLLSIIEHLEGGIKKLTLTPTPTNWTDYYETCSYSQVGYEAKKQFVDTQLKAFKGGLCVDLGANTGEFSALAAANFKTVVSCDNDAEVVNAIQAKKIGNLLALHITLENPTPAFGWNNEERKSFIERIRGAEFTMALALIHHLCIGNNVPLSQAAGFFANCSNTLLIEFVPKSDVQVKKLLVTKKDVFDDYTLENFKVSFNQYFKTLAQQAIPGSDRVLFLFTKL